MTKSLEFRITVSLFLIVFFSMSLTPSQSAKPPKVGDICTKAGGTKTHQGQRFLCVKKGKKLVWSKSIAIAKPQPTSTPSPSMSPIATPSPSAAPTITALPSPTPTSFQAWSIEIDSKYLSDQAQRNFLSWTTGRVGARVNHQQFIQPNPHSRRISILKKADDLGAQLFSSYFADGTVTVIGAEESWTIQELAKSGWDTKSCSDPYMPGVSLCLERGPSIARRQGYVVTSDTTYDARNPGSDGGALLAHEYFHLVQRSISKSTSGVQVKNGDANSINSVPAWFLEGTAEFVGYSVAALSQNASYWDGRAMMLSYAPPQESVNRNSIADYEIRACCGNSSPTYPYNIGLVATEFIVASIGFQKMLDIWSDFGVTGNFELSFERVTGISKSNFYEKFDQVRTKVGLPAVSWRLDGLVNKRIGG